MRNRASAIHERDGLCPATAMPLASMGALVLEPLYVIP